jgi:hypothetical protein
MDISWYGGVCKIGYLEYLYLLNIFAFRSKKSLSERFNNGQICMEGFVPIKREAVKM